MSALDKDKASITVLSGLVIPYHEYVIDSGAILYQGASLMRDPDDSMLVKPATAAKPLYYPLGMHTVSKVTGDAVKRAYALAGLYERENSAGGDEVLSTLPLGWPLYAVDDQTVSLTNGGGTRAFLGVFGGMSSNAKPTVWIGCDPIGLVAKGITIPIVHGHADLTAAAATQAFTLWTTPGPVRVAHPPVIDTLTDFSGGGTASATISVGAAADADALGTAKDIFTGADPGAMTAGVLGYPGALIASGTAITVTYTSDTTVAAYTAGALVGAIRLIPGS
jgi:hypothetical protein